MTDAGIPQSREVNSHLPRGPLVKLLFRGPFVSAVRAAEETVTRPLWGLSWTGGSGEVLHEIRFGDSYYPSVNQ